MGVLVRLFALVITTWALLGLIGWAIASFLATEML
jgi:hypothetical protein